MAADDADDEAAATASVEQEELKARQGRLRKGTWPYGVADRSAKARAWRALPSVQWALGWLRNASGRIGDARFTAYRHRKLKLRLHPGLDEAELSMSDLAMAFELALGPMNNERLLDAGIGLPIYGVNTQQSVTDSATLHALLYRVQPDLLIEVGTMCGGSAFFYIKTMMGYNPNATVYTFDANGNPKDRLKRCDSFHKAMEGTRRLHPQAVQGLRHPEWSRLTARGNLRPIIGDAATRKSQKMLEEAALKAKSVMVVDDGSHISEHVLNQWRALSRFVTVGSYYLIQDTRLDTDCAHAILKGKGGWCDETMRKGGPARAVAELVSGRADPSFAQKWQQDRTVEVWGITQHPGGYFLRAH